MTKAMNNRTRNFDGISRQRRGAPLLLPAEPAASATSGEAGRVVLEAPHVTRLLSGLKALRHQTSSPRHQVASFARHQPDHAQVQGEDPIISWNGPRRPSLNVDAIFLAIWQASFHDEQARSVQLPPAYLPPIRACAQLHGMPFADRPANTQPLRPALHAAQVSRSAVADLPIFVTEHTLQFVPASW